MSSERYGAGKSPLPSPDERYTVAFDEDNGAKYSCCAACCLLMCQTKCLLLGCFPCFNCCVDHCPSSLECCLFWPSKQLNKQHATITDALIEYKTGCLICKKLIIPIVRVQDVEVQDDWVLGFFGIKNLAIRTGVDRDAPPEALLMAPKNAEMVRDIIIQRRGLLVDRRGNDTSRPQQRAAVYSTSGTAPKYHVN